MWLPYFFNWRTPMKDWFKPEHRFHTLGLALAVTFVLVVTFLHGCASDKACEMVLVSQPNGDQIVDYRC